MGWHGAYTVEFAAIEGVPAVGSAGALARTDGDDAGGVARVPVFAEVQAGVLDVTGGEAVQCKVGAEGADGHGGVGVVERVRVAEEELRAVVGGEGYGREDAAEVGVGGRDGGSGEGGVNGLGVSVAVGDGDIGEGRADEVVGGGPLNNIRCTGHNLGGILKVQCQGAVGEG